MGIADILSGILGTNKAPASGGLAKFIESVTLQQFTSNADGKILYAGQQNDVATLKIPSQQLRSWGQNGVTAGGADLRGILFVSLFDNSATPVQIDGSLRLAIRNNIGDKTVVYVQPRTESLRGSKTDRQNSYLLGVQRLKAIHDSYLVISIEPDAEATFSLANSDALLPLTIYTE